MRFAARVLLPGTDWIAFTQLMDLVGLMMDLLGKRFLPRGSLLTALSKTDRWLPDKCLKPPGQLPDGCLVTAIWLQDDCQTTWRPLHNWKADISLNDSQTTIRLKLWAYLSMRLPEAKFSLKIVLKYGFCMKSLQKDETLTSWTLFWAYLSSILGGFAVAPVGLLLHPPKSDDKYAQKSVQLVRGSSFRNDLLQNPYFNLLRTALQTS